jgi:spore maturation protein CgeB
MDYVPEMEDLLKPGEEVIVYRSPAEGATLAKEFIKDPGARDKIAHAGYERVMAEHTYTHRMKTILDNI